MKYAILGHSSFLSTDARYIPFFLPYRLPFGVCDAYFNSLFWQRLHFYALLMRFPKIQSLEFEVSEWDPPPSSPAALRALASELRLYNPSVIRVVFVQDFDRTAVIAVDGICRVDREISTDLLWREK